MIFLEVSHKCGREYQAGKRVRLSSVFFVKFSPLSDQGEDVSTVLVCNGHLRMYHRACQAYRGVGFVGKQGSEKVFQYQIGVYLVNTLFPLLSSIVLLLAC